MPWVRCVQAMFDLTRVKIEITWQVEQLQVFHISVLVYVAVSLSLVSTLFLLVVREARQAVKRRQSIASMPESCPSGWGSHLSFNLNLHPSWLRSTSQPIIFAKSSPSRSFHFHSTSVVPPSPHTTLESCSIVLEKEGEFKYFQNSLFVSVALKWKWSLDT